MPRTNSDARLSGEQSDDNPLELTPPEGRGSPKSKRRCVAPQERYDAPAGTSAGRDHCALVDGCRNVEGYDKLNKIDEGAYGVVWRARCKRSERMVALKGIKLEKHPDGFPKSSLREITVLMALKHPNIVEVLEMVVGKSQNDVFMVMEYMEHELKTLLWDMAEGKRAYFSLSEVKSLMYQLCDAVAYMHGLNWMHRDLKSSNILFDNKGCLKVCDFGLARKFGDPAPRDCLTQRVAPYTGLVVTLWYRSPELILGWKPPEPNVKPYEIVYGPAVDVWSVGCIFGELLYLKPIFMGQNSELDHLVAIFSLTGTPTQTPRRDQPCWPAAFSMPLWAPVERTPGYNRAQKATWRDRFSTGDRGAATAKGVTLSERGLQLMQKMMECNPDDRISCQEALDHPWFQEAPAKAKSMPKWEDSNSTAHAARRRIKSDERYQPGAEGAAIGVCVNPKKFLEELGEAQESKQKVEEKLPPGWMERKSNSTGKVFFINLKTKETTWTRPTQPG